MGESRRLSSVVSKSESDLSRSILEREEIPHDHSFDQERSLDSYALRTALIVNGVHESKIYFTVQLGAN